MLVLIYLPPLLSKTTGGQKPQLIFALAALTWAAGVVGGQSLAVVMLAKGAGSPGQGVLLLCNQCIVRGVHPRI